MKKKPIRVISAPGRICLFGEHSDYLGLPIIAMAIDRRLEISAYPRRDRRFRILMPDIDDEESFFPARPLSYQKSRDYLRAGVNVLRRRGFKFPKGYDFVVRSNIPLQAGTSSSSALCVAWIRMLLSFQENIYTQFNPIEIAKLAYETEVVEFREPGGRMDHFAIACGELIYLENHKTIDLHYFKRPLAGMVIGDSLEKKETILTLKQNRKDVTSGFRQMKNVFKSFDVEKIELKKILEKFYPLPAELKKAVATLRNRDLCREAGKELMEFPRHPEKIGNLMNHHHAQLRDHLKISTPKIERMIHAARATGALGAKINGSGLGGTMIAYAPGREASVVKAITRVGGRAWMVHQSKGVIG